MRTAHKFIIGDSISMRELSDESVHLVVTSPPYFNAPFDYKDYFSNYDSYLNMITLMAKEAYRVLKPGRIFVLNIDDMLVNGVKYPITADATKIFTEVGFRYRDRIIWKKPDGYLRIMKRSKVISQNPYPMYFYPDNLLESLIIFQKGRFEYKEKTKEEKIESQINMEEFKNNKWHTTLWEINNVLPGSKFEKGVAAFPEEIPYRFIKLFSYKNEIVLDPYLGSGTTMKVARKLGRHSVGYEIDESLTGIVKQKCHFDGKNEIGNKNDKFIIDHR
jgi:site-specific DNA-methyltransferase (adenine-specific)